MPSSLRTETGTRLTKIKTVSRSTVAREYVEVMNTSSFVVGRDRTGGRDVSRSPWQSENDWLAGMLHYSDLLVLRTWQILLWIHGLIVDAHFVMQVRAGRTTGRAHQPDGLSAHHRVANANVDPGQVAIARRQPIAMIDIDDVAVAALPSRDGHFAGGGNLDRSAVRRINVLPFVILVTTTTERIPPSTDTAFKLSRHRPN